MVVPDNSFFQHKNDKVTNNIAIWCIVMMIIAVVAVMLSKGKFGTVVAVCSLISLFSMIGAGYIPGDVNANEMNEINKITDETSRNNALKEFNAKLDKKYKDDTGWPWVGLF